jgi:hypothetical protein
MAPPRRGSRDQEENAARKELWAVLHKEVIGLPESCRITIILSYMMEGKTNEEVAALLRWPVGTVKCRLSRARRILRSRLTRRGAPVSAAFVLTAICRDRVRTPMVPPKLITKTVQLASLSRLRIVPPSGSVAFRSTTPAMSGPPKAGGNAGQYRRLRCTIAAVGPGFIPTFDPRLISLLRDVSGRHQRERLESTTRPLGSHPGARGEPRPLPL